MRTVRVCTSKKYDIRIENGLLPHAGAHVAALNGAASAAVISDDTVFSLYGDTLCRSLQSAGLRVCSFVFPHGENSKSLAVYGEILHFLAENRITRSDLLVALGGGVVGDLGGFAAASYLRGIEYVQIPTTLLSAVDASVGGKTGLDLPEVKNAVGAFYQPSLVLCDPTLLSSLPEKEYRNGCAEVIKYALIGSSAFFDTLASVPVKEQFASVIEKCVSMKRDLVQKDEFDRGLRRVLNYGHTFGHAIEVLSGYEIAHGQAVGIGMCMMAKAAAAKGLCAPCVYEKTKNLLKQYALATETDISAERLLGALRSDKKADAEEIALIVPKEIGQADVITVPLSALSEWLLLGGAV